MFDWSGKPIPFAESVITNVGPEGDNIKDDPKEIRKYILEELSGVAVVANDEREFDYE